MKLDEICESERTYILRYIDEMNDFEDITVNMPSEFTKPESQYFTHCNINLNVVKNRTIPEHIKYFKSICEGLKQLQQKLEEKNEN